MMRRFDSPAIGLVVVPLSIALFLGCASELGLAPSGSSGTGGGGGGAAGGGASSGGMSNASGGTGSGGTASSAGGSPAGGSNACTTADVRPIFQSGCAQGACHDSSLPAAMLDLSGADPAGAMLNVPSSLCTSATLLVAGAPEQSFLWQKLTEPTPACGDPMPIGLPLSADALGCIEEWIVGLGSGVPDCETCGGSACIDLATDAQHCGGCDVACQAGQVCAGGLCAGCAGGQTACGTSCVDTTSAPNHCGGCGVVCGAGESCVDSKCQCTPDPSITFSGDIAPLFQTDCASNACHGGQMPKQGLDLRTNASLDSLVSIAATQCNDGRMLVAPGDPSNSYLLQKLTGVDMCSGGLMPKADAAYSPDTLAKISAWICSGAPMN